MTNKLLSPLAFMLVVGLGTAAFAQPDPDYFLRPTDVTGGPGSTQTGSILLDILGADNSAGWSYGVCHDSTHATLLGAVQGATTLTVAGGDPPDFAQINVFPEGYTIGVVISFLGTFVLAPGTDYELTTADYTLDGAPGTTSDITLCPGLGMPPVAVVIVVMGQSVAPVTATGTITIEIGPMVQEFIYDVGDQTVNFNPADGLASFDVNMSILDDNPPMDNTQGFSFGLAHDSALLDPTDVSAIGALAALDGGGGPDFFGDAILADGVTLGCVYSFLGAEFLTFMTPTDVVQIGYNTVPGDLIGDVDPTDTDLTFSSTLGSPPVDLVVVVAGLSVDAVGDDGTITLMPVVGPLLAQFITGDINQDDRINVADPVYLLNDLFAGGPDLLCPASGDIDGDGDAEMDDAVLLLEYSFLDGPPPADPFPDCGTRPGVLDADCQFDSCP